MTKLMLGMIFICSTIIVTSCGNQGREVVPEDVMEIYDSVEGGVVIGRSTTPVPVVGYVYPDKTRYVLQVCHLGRLGYVRDGIRELRAAESPRSSCPDTAKRGN